MAKKSMKGRSLFSLVTANRVGIFFIALYTLCFLWGYINPVQQELHSALLQLAFIGFEGFDLTSYWYGFVQVYVWGLIVSYLWDHTVNSCS